MAGNSFNILTFDGGGIKGLRSLRVIEHIEKYTGMLAYQLFDLIGGTSTGGIIAVLLSIGYSAGDIIMLYMRHGSKIFDKKFYRLGIFRPKYDDSYFNKTIREYVGSQTLLNCKTGLLVPAYNIDTMDKMLFKGNEQIHSLFDVIRATAAAQSYFSPHTINGERYIDGGNVINNTSLACYVEFLKKKTNKRAKILSIGTGRDEEAVRKMKDGGGMINWAKPTVDINMTEQTQQTDYYVSKLSEAGLLDYLRIEPLHKYADKEMDNASFKNMKLLNKDGLATVETYREEIDRFVSGLK